MSRVAQQALLAAVESPAAAVVYQGFTVSPTPFVNPTHTIPGVAIGAAAPGRRVYCFVFWAWGDDKGFSSATIGDVPATVHAQTRVFISTKSTYFGLALISAPLDTGTTATVVLNFAAGNTTSYCAVSSYSASGVIADAAGDTLAVITTGTSIRTGTIDVVKKGILLVSGFCSASDTYDVVGATKRHELSISVTNARVIGACLDVGTTELNRTVSIARHSGSVYQGPMLAGAFR